jgi:GntR family transcriptional regulator
MTVRKAYDLLVNEGLVIRKAGKGTFVANRKVSFNPSTLFSFSESMKTIGYTSKTEMISKKVIQAPPKILKALRLIGNDSVIEIRRLRFANGEPVSIDNTYISEGIYKSLLYDIDLTSRPLTEIMEETAGVRIVSSKDYAESVIATKEESALLQVPTGSPMLLISGIAYDENGFPQRYVKAVYRNDRFRFLVGSDLKPIIDKGEK